jgi:hypothetical protein
MQVGTENFNSYNRTLRRILWADFIDEQLRVARESTYRASLVEDDSRPAPASLLKVIENARIDRRE